MIFESYEKLLDKEGVSREEFKLQTKDDIRSMLSSIADLNTITTDKEKANINFDFLPEVIVDFLVKYTPQNDIDLGADVIQLTSSDMVRENTELMPGALMIGFKYLTFASTTGGNAICMNFNKITDGEPSICIVDHSIVSGRNIGLSKGMEMEFIELNESNASRVIIHVADKLSEFFALLLNDDIVDIEDLL